MTLPADPTALDPALVAQVRAFQRRVAPDVVARCADLVAAPSVNPPGDTREVAEVVRRALEAAGLPARLEHTDPAMPSVVAEIDSGRPGPHLILNVHLDTMPPGDESRWTVPVWELTRRDGRLYGLGMGNMKGAVAAMVSAAEVLGTLRAHWRGRVTMLAVSDEVVFGENGAAHLLRAHPDLYGDGLICGEGPGFRRLAIGEKGVLWVRLAATADGGHSSAVRRGASATSRLSRALVAVDDLNGRRFDLPAGLTALAAGADERELALSVNAGTVAGGTFVGQIATRAAAELDLRLPPGLTADAAEQLVRDQVAAVGGEVDVSRIKAWDPNWTDPADALTQDWVRAAQALGRNTRYAIRLPASDASRWRRAAVPSLCYGPQPTWSAGLDDYADEDEVLDCVSLYALAALCFLRP
jgi:succinyl-diaminopimelate desuccinylase